MHFWHPLPEFHAMSSFRNSHFDICGLYLKFCSDILSPAFTISEMLRSLYLEVLFLSLTHSSSFPRITFPGAHSPVTSPWYSDSDPCLTETCRRCPWCWSPLPALLLSLHLVKDVRCAAHFSLIGPGNCRVFLQWWQFCSLSLCLYLQAPQPLYSLKSTNLHTGVHRLLRSTSLIHFYWKVFLRNDAYSCASFLLSLCQAPCRFSVAQYFLTARGGLLRAHSSAVFLFYLHMSP